MRQTTIHLTLLMLLIVLASSALAQEFATVTFNNKTKQTVDVYVVAGPRELKHFHSIRGRSHVDVETRPGSQWVFYIGDRRVGRYQVDQNARQSHDIQEQILRDELQNGLRRFADRKINQLFGGNNEPGGGNTNPTRSAAPTAAPTIVPSTPEPAPVAPASPAAPAVPSQRQHTVQITFNNFTDNEVAIYVMEDDGSASEHQRLPAGTYAEIESLPGIEWNVGTLDGYVIVGPHITTRALQQTVDVRQPEAPNTASPEPASPTPQPTRPTSVPEVAATQPATPVNDPAFDAWVKKDQPRGIRSVRTQSTPWEQGFRGTTVDVEDQIILGYNVLRMDGGDLTDRGTSANLPILAPMPMDSVEYDKWGGFMVPNHFQLDKENVAAGGSSSKMYFSSSERQRGFSVNASFGGGIGGDKAGFKQSTRGNYSKLKTELNEGRSISIRKEKWAAEMWMTLVKERCSLAQGFVGDVQKLKSYGDYKTFFEDYGTHYPVSSLLGGKAYYEEFVETQRVLNSISKQFGGGNSGSASLKGVQLEREIGFSVTDNQKMEENKRNGRSLYKTIGGSGSSYDSWALSENNKHVPIKVELRPVYELVLPRLFGAETQAEASAVNAMRRSMTAMYNTYLDKEGRVERERARPRRFECQLDSFKIASSDDKTGGPDLYGTIALRLFSKGRIKVHDHYYRNEEAVACFSRTRSDEKDLAVGHVEVTRAIKRVIAVEPAAIGRLTFFADLNLADVDGIQTRKDDHMKLPYHPVSNPGIRLADVIAAGGSKEVSFDTPDVSGFGKLTLKLKVRELDLAFTDSSSDLPRSPISY